MDYLTQTDVENLIGPAKVREYLDDNLDGDTVDETTILEDALDAAESEAEARMLRSWSREQIVIMGTEDRAFRRHVAWIACEFLSQRRTGFSGPNGEGAYGVQYERAMDYFDALSKAKIRSRGEAEAGTGGNVGGTVQPYNDPPFIFAPSKNYPTGHGGF